MKARWPTRRSKSSRVPLTGLKSSVRAGMTTPRIRPSRIQWSRLTSVVTIRTRWALTESCVTEVAWRVHHDPPASDTAKSLNNTKRVLTVSPNSRCFTARNRSRCRCCRAISILTRSTSRECCSSPTIRRASATKPSFSTSIAHQCYSRTIWRIRRWYLEIR